MNNYDDQRLSDLLQRANPVETAEGPLDRRAESDLAKALRTRSSRPVPRRLVPVIAAAAVLLTVGAGALVTQPWKDGQQPQVGDGGSNRVTDTRPATVQLREFADRVRALPAEPVTGPVLKVETLLGGVDYTEGEPPQELRGESVTYYVKDGVSYNWDNGRLAKGDKVYWPRGQSVDPEVLRAELPAEPSSGTEAHRLTSAITNLQMKGKPGPGLRAAILDLLAGLPGITADGETEDRAGRQAVAFSVPTETNPVRITLLFDPRTGVLLGTHDTTTKALPKLGLPKGGLASYGTYVSQTYQAALPTKPE